MEFTNHTPFPALAFAGVDSQGSSFHVVALRQTLTWGAQGELHFAEQQAPLCEADEPFAEESGDIRQESDLCPYKPRCDVIVNATAYAPVPATLQPGQAYVQFDVQVTLKRPDQVVLPLRPQGYNQFQPPSPEQLKAWEQAVARAQSQPKPGERLLEKTLRITGVRRFEKSQGALAFYEGALSALTLGLANTRSWYLSPPEPLQKLPLRLKYAFGGQCRIEVNDPAAARVPEKHRLTPEQIEQHPNAQQAPVAHEALQANPVGQGYVTPWYLEATNTATVPAPQIEDPDHPVTLAHFEQARAGKLKASELPVAGLGVRSKGHPERVKLVGTVDQAFIKSDAALPPDFDFAIWNAAWPDQQIDSALLQGEEDTILELINLCATGTPAMRRDANGNAVLSLKWPKHLPFILVRFETGEIGELEAKLDTMVIDVEERQIGLVWRATLPQELRVRVLEARMRQAAPAQVKQAINQTSIQKAAIYA